MTNDIEIDRKSIELSYKEIQQVIRKGRAERNLAVGGLFVALGALIKIQMQTISRLGVRFGDWLDPHPTPHR